MDIQSSLDKIIFLILLIVTIFYWASIIYTDFKLSLGFAQVLTWCRTKPMQLRTTDIDEAILFAIGNQIRGSKIRKDAQFQLPRYEKLEKGT